MADIAPSSEVPVTTNLNAVRDRIDAAATAAGRNPAGITLIAVSKMHDVGRILPTLEAGHRAFGESRVQEAQAKWPELRARFSDIELHLIGPVQTKKAKVAVALFDVIHSVDREKLAAALAREMDKTGRRPACFIQVNTGEEPQKAGVPPAEADRFIALCRERYQLPLMGLMCIPPVTEEPSLHFALLAKIAKRNGLQALSMGMSDDFETAIAFGSSHVRLGTAIFGERPGHFATP
ncbi:MAG: YggS family pyridoxal phosphate-dependent enzyme [Sphingomonadales bacterium]